MGKHSEDSRKGSLKRRKQKQKLKKSFSTNNICNIPLSVGSEASVEGNRTSPSYLLYQPIPDRPTVKTQTLQTSEAADSSFNPPPQASESSLSGLTETTAAYPSTVASLSNISSKSRRRSASPPYMDIIRNDWLYLGLVEKTTLEKRLKNIHDKQPTKH
jgi:hypothetical protein